MIWKSSASSFVYFEVLTLDMYDRINQPAHFLRPKKAQLYCPQTKLMIFTMNHLLQERIWLYRLHLCLKLPWVYCRLKNENFFMKNIYFKYLLSYVCILDMNWTLDILDTINQPSYSPRPKKACTYCPQTKLMMVTVKYLLTERIWLYIFMFEIAQSVLLTPKRKLFLKNIKFKIIISYFCILNMNWNKLDNVYHGGGKDG